MKTRFALLAAMILASTQAQAAAAQTSTPQPPLDPVGKYDITAQIDGQTISSAITITRQDGRFAGTMRVHGEEIPFSRVSVENRTVTLTGPDPHGDGTLTLTIAFKTSDTFDGTLSMQGSTGTVKGSRARS